MSKEERVIEYYVLCNHLKKLIRSGWKLWNVEKPRLESVAEHIYGVQQLAIAMASEFHYDIDLKKVIMMLAIHELEEIYIGDIPMSATDYEEKKKAGHAAVLKVLEPLEMKEYLADLVFEFDRRETKEALFAYHCDKLECDIQAKLYDEEGYIDLNHQQNNPRYASSFMQNLVSQGVDSFTELWYTADEPLYKKDENFQKVFHYARTHYISNEELNKKVEEKQ